MELASKLQLPEQQQMEITTDETRDFISWNDSFLLLSFCNNDTKRLQYQLAPYHNSDISTLQRAVIKDLLWQ